MEAATATLQAKLTQLCLAKERTPSIIETKITDKITRHQQALKVLVNETDHWKREVERFKIAHKEDLTETEAWNTKIDDEISEAEKELA